MLSALSLDGIVHSIWRLVGIICSHGDLGEQSLISKMTFAFRFAAMCIFQFFPAGHPLAQGPLARTLPGRTRACAVKAARQDDMNEIKTLNYISKPGLAVMISV